MRNIQDGSVHSVGLLHGAKKVFTLRMEHFLNSNGSPTTGHRHFMRLLLPRIEEEEGIAEVG
jgi:hypothetical protein